MSETKEIIKISVKEFEVEESSGTLPLGAKYSYFQDTNTGKYYRPTNAFSVDAAPEDLHKWFEEVTE